ncbi:DUF4893 domain-containing protein [Tabrizicola sp.]|uniref:DUF4893 domain-containing protein n=1 Tax=Tabrizicola sp. TaxID=2005166 RepID=UPI003F2DED1D
MLSRVAFALSFLVAASPVLADGTYNKNMSRADFARFVDFEATKTAALANAEKAASAEKLNSLDWALEGGPIPMDASLDPAGDWTCQMIKVDGPEPIAVFPAVPCLIRGTSVDDHWWWLEMTEGPEPTTGTLYRDYTGGQEFRVFLGATHDPGGAPQDYNDDPGRDRMAIVTRRAGDRLLFEFPSPPDGWAYSLIVLER